MSDSIRGQYTVSLLIAVDITGLEKVPKVLIKQLGLYYYQGIFFTTK